MNWIARVALVFVSLATAGFGALACGGGDSLTLEEYFAELVAADQEFNERGDALFESVNPEDPDAVREAFNQYPDIVGDFVSELDDIDPPEEAEEAHERAVEAGNDVQEEFENILDEAGDDATAEELFTATEGEAFTEATDRFQTACLDLQQVADENNVDADLNCEEEG